MGNPVVQSLRRRVCGGSSLLSNLRTRGAGGSTQWNTHSDHIQEIQRIVALRAEQAMHGPLNSAYYGNIYLLRSAYIAFGLAAYSCQMNSASPEEEAEAAKGYLKNPFYIRTY